MTTGKTIALTRWTFVDKVMCLLFNMLSRLLEKKKVVPVFVISLFSVLHDKKAYFALLYSHNPKKINIYILI